MINYRKSIFETKDNNDKLDNLINTIDIILKILGYTLSSNQKKETQERRRKWNENREEGNGWSGASRFCSASVSR